MGRIENLLRDLGQMLTGQPFALDAHGLCELQLVKGLQLVIEPEAGSDTVHLHSTLARLPPGEIANSVYGELLTANLFGQGTGGACFAIHRAHDAIVLNRSFEITWLDSTAFGELVEAFMDAAEYWAARLESLNREQPTEAAETVNAIRSDMLQRATDFFFRA